MEMIPIVIGAFGTVIKGLAQGLGNKRTSRDPSNHSVVKIGQNTEKSPGNFWKLAVTVNKSHEYDQERGEKRY